MTFGLVIGLVALLVLVYSMITGDKQEANIAIMFGCALLAISIYTIVTCNYIGYPATIIDLEENSVVEVISCQLEPGTDIFLAVIKMPDNSSRLLQLTTQFEPGLGKVIQNDKNEWILTPFPAK